MTLTDFLIPTFTFFCILAAYLVFGQQISAIEGRARNDLERWKLECMSTINEGRNVLY